MNKKLKDTLINKSSLIVLVLLFLITIITGALCFFNKDYRNGIISLITVIILFLPSVLEKKCNIKFTTIFKIIIYLYIFSNSILGEVNHFYINYKYWDFMLHTVGGFIFTAIGLSLIHKYKLNFLLILIITISFSMTVSLSWEFFEYTSDKYFYTDTEKDTIIKNISSFSVDKVKNYQEEKIKEIGKTVIYGEDGEVLRVINGGYLDIGLNDTISDLGANFLGTSIFWFINYLSIYGKKRIVNVFLIKKVMS